MFSFLNSPLQAGVTEGPASSCGPVWDFKEVPLPLAEGSGDKSALEAVWPAETTLGFSTPNPSQATISNTIHWTGQPWPRTCSGFQ